MYSYENYAKVKEELAARRQKALDEAAMRAESLRLRSEEINEIDTELAKTGPMIFSAACRGEDISPLKRRNLELQEKKKALIKALGYPDDYTEVPYFCRKCSDTGYTENGAVCSCLKEALVKATIASSGMGMLIEKQSFENFDLSRFEPETKELMQHNLAVAKAYVRDFSKKRGNLILIGKTGTGKTHISSAIAREIINKGFDVVYDSTPNILNDFENERFRNDYNRHENITEKYFECDLLIIDDLGTEFHTAFTVSALYNLLNTRQNKGLATIISTNLEPSELISKYEDRIYSRMLGKGTVALRFGGKDYRVTR